MHFNIVKWFCSIKKTPQAEDSYKSAGNVNSQRSDSRWSLSYAKPPFNSQMFCGIVTRNYTKGSKTDKNNTHLEIALRLLKEPLVIRLTPLFPDTVAMSASHVNRTYLDPIPLNHCFIGLG